MTEETPEAKAARELAEIKAAEAARANLAKATALPASFVRGRAVQGQLDNLRTQYTKDREAILAKAQGSDGSTV